MNSYRNYRAADLSDQTDYVVKSDNTVHSSLIHPPLKMEILCFKLNEKEYGIPISGLARIIRMVAITPVSELSNYHLGVINLHGQIVPVFDIRRCLGLQRRTVSLRDCIIILEVDDKKGAIIADTITEIIDADASDIYYVDEPTRISQHIDSMLKWDGKVLPMFNPESLLSLTE